ncbi:uncharacterized protein LOC134844599 isoform X2 [Symsagittifera roscoffensis]|uniref:uncharacterized protein LOC134844599 isoform X2 n=1 Tax=Symsagittifera roscoffensis TaxID=84072 RepID=UPI00307CB38C
MADSSLRDIVDLESPCFILDFWTEDVLRLFNISQDLYRVIKAAILQFYSPGIQKEKLDYNCINFKLNGYPFAYSKPVFVKRDDHKIFCDTLCQMLQNLSFVGWEASMALNLNSCNTLSSIFFKRSDSEEHKVYSAVNLYMSNKMQLINCSDEVFTAVLQCCRKMWSPGVTTTDSGRFSDASLSNSFTIQLGKTPWESSNKASSTDCALLMMELFTCLRCMGLNFEFACHLSNNAQQTLIFSKKVAITNSCVERDLMTSQFNSSAGLCAFNFSHHNRLELVMAPKELEDLVTDIITNHEFQTTNIQSSERINAASQVFKLNSKPWNPPVEPEVVLLVNNIVNNTWSQLGWQSLVSLDISRIGNSNTSLLLMEKDEFWKPSSICCVYFHASYKLLKNRFFISIFNFDIDHLRLLVDKISSTFRVKKWETIQYPSQGEGTSQRALYQRWKTKQSWFRWEFETDVWTTCCHTSMCDRRYTQLRMLQLYLFDQITSKCYEPMQINTSLVSGPCKQMRHSLHPFVDVVFFKKSTGAPNTATATNSACYTNHTPSSNDDYSLGSADSKSSTT